MVATRLPRLLPALLLFAAFAANAIAQVPEALFGDWEWRLVGPFRGGRVAAVCGVEGNRDTYWFGSTGGGVWKTGDAGKTWQNVSDGSFGGSIGAVAVAPSKPDTVYVGGGEKTWRGNVSSGDGIWKTTDGGKTWEFCGLPDSRHISRIRIHPRNPDLVYAAVMGHVSGPNDERGVYRSKDGGANWERVLFANADAGAVDLCLDASDPQVLYATTWRAVRTPWSFSSGGDGSGLWKSTDGGDTWQALHGRPGLPSGVLGICGIASAPSRPQCVYALVEAKESALLRSDNGGASWRTVNKEPGVNPRPFYFCDIRVHPTNENKVYRLQTTLDYSIDGGKTFSLVYPYTTIHPDHHALWLHPDGKYMIVGNDGGIGISRDGGAKWQFVDNLPLGQFYHIATDNEHPYNVYGGLQDNGSWRGPSNSLVYDGIYNGQWVSVNFGDGFATVPDPENSDYGYAMAQGGALVYYNHKTQVRKVIRPTESEGANPPKHRYNWNAGIALDPFAPKTVYYGSQFLHKSTDKGQSWQIISPDLTTNDPAKQKSSESGGLTRDVTAAENHCTILSIAPSPLKQEIIWVSTDDGNVQVTQDGGKTWANVSPANSKTVKVSGGAVPPQGTWSPHVEASKHDAATAFVVFDDHRRSNWETYVYVTRDYGKTWTSLATKEIDGFCHVVRQDPVEPNLLFVGTEFGLFVSVNGGKNWSKWTAGLPTVPVTDMVIHLREHDLVIATHGRGVYILDDIRPLRELAKVGVGELARKPLHIFAPGKATIYNTEFWAGSYVGSGHALFQGQQRAVGAMITYAQNPPDSTVAKEGTAKAEKINVEVLSLNGKDTTVLRTLKATSRKGLNRIVWDGNRRAFEVPSRTERAGGRRGGGGMAAAGASAEQDPDEGKISLAALPGTYHVRIKQGTTTLVQPFELEADPRVKTSMDALKSIDAMQTSIGGAMESLSKVCKQIVAVKKTIKAVNDFSGNLDKAKADSLTKRGKTLETKLDSLLDEIVPEDARVGGIFDRSMNVLPQVYEVLYTIGSSYDAPTQAAQVKMAKVKARVQATLKKANDLFAGDVEAFKKDVEGSGLSLWSKTETVNLKE